MLEERLMALPVLQEYDGGFVDVLVPGLIVADPRRRFGSPCLIGTRMPAGLYWLWELRDSPQRLKDEGFTREEVVALYSFGQGMEWQRSRSRRKRMGQLVHELWEEIRQGHREQWELPPGL